ncbi:MAG: hypothetical protein WB662_07070 [Methyloceanibacter sp.]|jgi:hypothetical protein
MSLWKLVLAGIAALSFLIVLQPDPSGAASLAVARDGFGSASPRPEPATFHSHSPSSYYCYPRNYWWFYRPYTTAQEGYARCLPYFHYPPQAFGRRAPTSGLK